MRCRELRQAFMPPARATVEHGFDALMTIHQVVGFPGRAEMRAVSLRAGFELARVGLAERARSGFR